MGQEPSLEELRLGARIYSISAAVASLGFVVGYGAWKYLAAGIAVVCFVRSVVYFWKAWKKEKSTTDEHR